MKHQSFYQHGWMLFEAVKQRDQKSFQSRSVLIWCFVCKNWIPAWPDAEACPRCDNDDRD